MVFKRYIRKHGKKLGPYYYENVRSNDGRVKSVYIGTNPLHHTKHRIRKPLFFVILVLILILILGGSLFLMQNKSYLLHKTKQEPNFEIDQILLKVIVRSGEYFEKQVRVMSTGDQQSSISVDVSGLSDIVSADSREFILKPGQTKIVTLNFSSFISEQKIEQQPGIYVGKLVLRSEKGYREVPVVIEIETKNALFDLNLKKVGLESRVKQGSETAIEVQLFNLENIDSQNVDVEYFVKDMNGNTIVTESETVVVKTQASFFKTISIPKNLKPGSYIFAGQAKFGKSVGTSSYLFEVVGPETESSFVQFCKNNILCLGLSITTILLLFALMAYFYFFIGAYLYEKVTGTGMMPERKAEKAERYAEKDYREQKPSAIANLGLVFQRWKKALERRKAQKEAYESHREIREIAEQKKIQLDDQRKNEGELRRQEDAGKQRELEERQREQQRIAEEKKRQEDERKKREDQQRKQKAQQFFRKIGLFKTPEEKRKAALQKEKEKQEKERLRQEELKRTAELRKQKELERQREEEKRKKIEEELRKQKELDRQKSDEEKRKEDETLKKQRELEEKRKLEEEQKRQLEEQKKRLEEERIRQEELKRRKELEEKRRIEDEKKRKEQQRIAEEKKRQEDERKKREDQQRKQRELQRINNEKARAQKLELIKQTESRLEKNREESKKLFSQLKEIDSQNINSSKRLYELDEKITGIEHEIAEKSRQQNELGLKRKLLDEDYKKRLEEIAEMEKEENKSLKAKKTEIRDKLSNKEIEMMKGMVQELKKLSPEKRKSAEKWKKLEIRAKLKLEEQDLEGQIKKEHGKANKSRNEADSKYKKDTELLNTQQRQLRKEMLELKNKKQEMAFEKSSTPKTLIENDSRAEKKRQKLDNLKKEHEKLGMELSALRLELRSGFGFIEKLAAGFRSIAEAGKERKRFREKIKAEKKIEEAKLRKEREDEERLGKIEQEKRKREEEKKIKEQEELLKREEKARTAAEKKQKTETDRKEKAETKRKDTSPKWIEKILAKKETQEKYEEKKPEEGREKIKFDAKFETSGNFGKCRKALQEAKACIGRNDAAAAKKSYTEARNLYVSLDYQEKKEIYSDLMEVYNALSKDT